jgi:hypothetical protein
VPAAVGRDSHAVFPDVGFATLLNVRDVLVTGLNDRKRGAPASNCSQQYVSASPFASVTPAAVSVKGVFGPTVYVVWNEPPKTGALLVTAVVCAHEVLVIWATISWRLTVWKYGSLFAWMLFVPQIPAYAWIVVPLPGS